MNKIVVLTILLLSSCFQNNEQSQTLIFDFVKKNESSFIELSNMLPEDYLKQFDKVIVTNWQRNNKVSIKTKGSDKSYSKTIKKEKRDSINSVMDKLRAHDMFITENYICFNVFLRNGISGQFYNIWVKKNLHFKPNVNNFIIVNDSTLISW